MSTISSLAFSKIKPNSTISLGGGSNVFNLAKEIAKHPEYNLTIYSPSELTILNCQKLGLRVYPIQQAASIDVAFDGCDSVDYNLNALKSNGGIHYFEKIAAQKSKQYILLLPMARITRQLSNQVQLCLEVIPESSNSILSLTKKMNLKATIRQGSAVASLAYTKNGNQLIDIYNKSWEDIDNINQELLIQDGVVSSSYFHNLVTSLITQEDNQAIEIKKGDLK